MNNRFSNRSPRKAVVVHSIYRRSISFKMGWDKDRFVNKDSILSDLICAICTDVISDPIQTPCEHCFCKSCISRWLEEEQKSCPIDRKQLTQEDLKKPNRVTLQLLSNLVVRCRYFVDGCGFTAKLENDNELNQHESESCPIIMIQNLQNQNEELKNVIFNIKHQNGMNRFECNRSEIERFGNDFTVLDVNTLDQIVSSSIKEIQVPDNGSQIGNINKGKTKRGNHKRSAMRGRENILGVLVGLSILAFIATIIVIFTLGNE